MNYFSHKYVMSHFFSCHSINADNWWLDSKGWPGFACCVTMFFPSFLLVRLPQRKKERERVLFSSSLRSSAYFSVSSLISAKLARGVGIKLVPFEILLTCSKLCWRYLLSSATPSRKRRRDVNISKSFKDKEIFYVDMNVPVL